MAVTLDAKAGKHVAGNVTSTSYNHVTGSGANRLIMILATSEGNAGTVTATVDGNAATAKANTSYGPNVYIFYYLSQAVGTNAIVVSNTTSREMTVETLSFHGVDQANPLGTAVSATGATDNLSVNVATQVGDIVVGVFTTLNTSNPTPDSGQTEQSERDTTSHTGATSTEPGSSGTENTGWTGGDSFAALIGVSVQFALPAEGDSPLFFS